MKTYRYILALVVILAPTCLLAAERRASGKVEGTQRTRNEVEEHWTMMYKRYDGSERGGESRESKRGESSEKESVPKKGLWGLEYSPKGSKSRRSPSFP